MSCDLVRLKSASALRDWEESRAKNFSAWHQAAQRLLDNLQAAVQLGASQHAQLQLLLLQRSAADKAYAQALVRVPDQEGELMRNRSFSFEFSRKAFLASLLLAMSLGWLTESSLIPKEPKQIGGVSTSSLLNLQAVVYDREQRGNVPSAKRRKAVAEAKARNEGVDARNARDEQQRDAQERPDLVRQRLEEKAKRYEALAAGAAAEKDEPLVDFDRKRAQGFLPPVPQVLEEVAAAVQEIDPSAVWPARFLAAACSVADCPNSKLKIANKINGSLGTATVVAVSFWHFFHLHLR
eukprot:symbB.v1.2.032127.t1/scaffold3806.1/size49987/4